MLLSAGACTLGGDEDLPSASPRVTTEPPSPSASPSPSAVPAGESACSTGGGGSASSKINYRDPSANVRPAGPSFPTAAPPIPATSIVASAPAATGAATDSAAAAGTAAPAGIAARDAAASAGDSATSAISAATGARAAARAPARALPWKDRPVVKLCFDVPADRQLVTGHESIAFTPDAPTCELVFRAWPNKPETAVSGNRLDVGQVTVDGKPATPRVESGGAPEGEPGTLVRVPLSACAKAGQKLAIELDFTLRLGRDTPERVGYSSGDLTAWFATAYPLLAWERGSGWATDPAVDLLGETVTSEDFQLAELRVIAPSADTVFGSGESLGEQPGPKAGTTEHRFSAPAVRDVAVSVGRFEVEERTVGTTRLHVAARADARFPAETWADETERAVTGLAARFGPFPYDDLWVTIVPDITSGIEFPGAIQFGDVDPVQFEELVPHEVAHMWFYGLVGNNQARDPWLDESFAEYAEVLVNGTDTSRLSFVAPPPVRDRVGESMQWYAEPAHRSLYGPGVYRQGAAMLLKAREAVGAARWDQLLRAYIDTNAHRIVDDEDVRKAFASEPEALSILRQYGAFVN